MIDKDEYPYLKISCGHNQERGLYCWLSLDPASYKITYKNIGDGVDNSKNPTSYKPVSGVTLKNPTRKGYTFKGWYSDSKYKKKVTKISTGSTGNKKLYAKWKKKK